MKQSYLKSLLLLLAMVWAIPKSTAVEYELTVNTTAEWKQSFSTPGSDAKGAGVGKDYKIWTVGMTTEYSSPYNAAYRVGSTGVETFSCGYSDAGEAVTNDDALNVIWTPTYVTSAIKTLLVWDNDSNPANKKTIDLTNYSPGAARCISAEGDIMNGTGYVWFVTPKDSKIQRVTIVSGTATRLDSWPLVDSDGNSITLTGDTPYLKKYDTGKCYLLDRAGKGMYDVAVNSTNAVCTSIPTSVSDQYANGSIGGCIFMFKGHKLLFCNTSANYSAAFKIVDMSDGNKVLATITDYTTTISAHRYGRTIIPIVNPDNENKLDLYTYKSGVCAAKYSITATEVANFTDPVLNLKAARTFNTDASQDATLTWSAPATGADYVTGYTIYKDEATVTTVAAGTTAYTYAGLTASSEFNVVPNYNYNGTVTVGTDSKVTIAPYVYTTPQNVNAEHYSGYARASISFTKISRTTGIEIRYDIVRDGTVISTGLSQNEYIDTYIPEGEHTYAVEAVYYIADADGNYTIEIKRMRSEEKPLLIDALNTVNVNYTLEEVYNYEMWDIWDADQANGKKLPANFNPNLKTDKGYIDAEHYRQGALVTDSNGKKWWYIAQKSNTTNFDAYDGGTSGGVLKISAENADLQAGGNASLLDLSTAGEIKVGQTAGIAADANGNFLVRGWNQTYDDAGPSAYNDGMNYGSKLVNVVIYSADLTKRFEVPLNFDLDADDVQTNQYTNGRIDYYRVSGDLMGTSYLYVVCGASRTFTVIKMVNDGTNVTASLVKQYTPTTIGDTGEEIKVSAGDGYENYAFDIESGQGSAGYVYQKRSVGYLYVPTAATSNTGIFTEDGKLANSGGTTVRMANANDASASQLFIITPQSFLSRNTGSFSVELVTGNDFANGTVPIATKVQDASDNVIATSEAGNANGNWLFAEYNATDKSIYIYQYVPGIRIAKYRLYGSVGFLDSKPKLDITTSYDADKENITHFTATTSWSTPADYKGAGDYAISHYKVELLDAANKVIDSKDVKATEGYGTDWSSKDYSLTFNTTADITPATGVTVATGDTDNHFVDNASPYTARVTAVYDLTSVLNGTSGADSDLRSGAVRSVQTTHDYGVKDPAGEVTIYEGVGTVNNVYRIEINIENMEEGEEPVSHYEIAYNYTDASGNKVTVPVDNFVLVTADAQTEGQSVVPGADVRNSNNGYALSESQGKSFVCFYQDNRVLEDTNKDGHPDYTYPTEEDWQIPSNWTYTITAVYAANNSLLRNTTAVTLNAPDTMIETGVESVGGDAAASLNAFPIPATSTLTVQAPQGIESISIISAAGVEVKSVAGNGESMMSIAVDDLAAGYYMLRVNGLAPIKIVKK